MSIYAAKLSGELLTCHTSASDDTTGLEDELTLLRVAVTQVVDLWNSATLLATREPDPEARLQHQATAVAISEQVRKAVNEVRVMHESISKIRSLDSRINGPTPSEVISSVMRKVRSSPSALFRDEMIGMLEAELRESQQQPIGTTLTPSDVSSMVIGMDATVPKDKQREFNFATPPEDDCQLEPSMEVANYT